MDLFVESVGGHVALSIPACHLVQFKGKWSRECFSWASVCGALLNVVLFALFFHLLAQVSGEIIGKDSHG